MLFLTLLVLAQPHAAEPWTRLTRGERVQRAGSRLGKQFASFEFAPLQGTGIGDACACVNPKGARGETITFTRASNGTCTKGNTSSSISNGDLVICSTNQARVMAGGDGTGARGLLIEPTRTNTTIWSQSLDNVAWTGSNSVAAATTVTADYGTAPDGTATAERLQIPATTGAGYSLRRQTGGCPAGTVSPSIYIKGNGESGTVSITDPAGGASCSVCSYVAGSWTRCSYPNRTGTVFYIGHDSADCSGNPAFLASDVLAWGAQCEAGAYVTSYIPTTTVAVARAVEVATVDISGWTSSNTLSMSATIVPNWTTTTVEANTGILTMNGANASSLYVTTALRFLTGATANPSSALTSATPVRVYGYDNGTNAVNSYGANTNSVATGAAANRFGTSLGLGDGAPAGVTNLSGVIKQVCVDPNPLRCR